MLHCVNEERRRGAAVLPSTHARRSPSPPNRRAYRRRSAVERLFGRMKEWRRTIMRLDRLAGKFLSAIELMD